ncbi:hypothetical protein ACJJTC_001199 [Scirpophaga incertulas]
MKVSNCVKVFSATVAAALLYTAKFSDAVINLQALFKDNNEELVHPKPDHNYEIIVEQARRERLNVHSRTYTAGWVAKRRLNYPSEGAERCFGTIISETNEYLEQNAHHNNLTVKIRSKMLSKYSFEFIDCTEHKDVILNYFINLTVRFSIINWCSVINKILKGTDIIRLEKSILPALQKKAYEKIKKIEK